MIAVIVGALIGGALAAMNYRLHSFRSSEIPGSQV